MRVIPWGPQVQGLPLLPMQEMEAQKADLEGQLKIKNELHIFQFCPDLP